MTKYSCPHCSPYTPFLNKESLFMHLQKEHNLNATDAIQTCELMESNQTVLEEMSKDIDLTDSLKTGEI